MIIKYNTKCSVKCYFQIKYAFQYIQSMSYPKVTLKTLLNICSLGMGWQKHGNKLGFAAVVFTNVWRELFKAT